MRIRMQKDHMRTLMILRSMSEFGGLWKHQNNPARTKSVRVLTELKLDTIRKKKKEHIFSVKSVVTQVPLDLLTLSSVRNYLCVYIPKLYLLYFNSVTTEY